MAQYLVRLCFLKVGPVILLEKQYKLLVRLYLSLERGTSIKRTDFACRVILRFHGVTVHGVVELSSLFALV